VVVAVQEPPAILHHCAACEGQLPCDQHVVFRVWQLDSFHMQFFEPHVPQKPTGLAAHGTYHEL